MERDGCVLGVEGLFSLLTAATIYCKGRAAVLLDLGFVHCHSVVVVVVVNLPAAPATPVHQITCFEQFE